MSRIDDLILRHCPNGVAFHPLCEVAQIKNGKDYRTFGVGPVPVYGTGGIMARIDTAAHSGPSVLIPRKGSLGNIYYVDEPFWTGDTIFYTVIDESRVIPKFLYYVLVKMRLSELNQAGGVPSLTQAMLNPLPVPVPPVPVQREIVRVLDLFQSLEAALEAELEARREQFAHYRAELLRFGNHVARKPLGELAVVGTGSHDTKDAVPDGDYVFFARGRDPLRLNSFDFDERAIITAGDGVGVGKVFHFAEGKYALHQRAYRVVPNAEADARYLYHYLVADFGRYLEQTSVHASVTSLRRPMFLNYPVALPPLDDQRSIASTLDKFEALVNDLRSGLPAEIGARRAQYEYYRDRLLSFEEAVA